MQRVEAEEELCGHSVVSPEGEGAALHRIAQACLEVLIQLLKDALCIRCKSLGVLAAKVDQSFPAEQVPDDMMRVRQSVSQTGALPTRGVERRPHRSSVAFMAARASAPMPPAASRLNGSGSLLSRPSCLVREWKPLSVGHGTTRQGPPKTAGAHQVPKHDASK